MTRSRTIEDSRRDYKTLKARIGREGVNARARAWRLANPERAREVLAKSRKNNPERKLFSAARSRAKVKGWEFNLELSDIVIPEKCPLLEVILDSWGHKDVCPSLDRINNTKGYVKGNVQVISFKANRMKNTATLEELRVFAHNILERHKDVINYT